MHRFRNAAKATVKLTQKSLIVHIAVNRIAPRVVVSKVANFSSAVDKLDAPGSSKDVDPKIVSIVDQISGLTLLQTADLVSLLKVLHISRGGQLQEKMKDSRPLFEILLQNEIL